jgi:hypothetical protein
MPQQNDHHDEFIKFQAETNMKLVNLEKDLDCHEERISNIEETQNEFKVSLGKLTLQASIAAVVAGGLATGLWTLIQKAMQ